MDIQELLARVRSLARMKQFTDDLDSASSIITTLATMIEAREALNALRADVDLGRRRRDIVEAFASLHASRSLGVPEPAAG